MPTLSLRFVITGLFMCWCGLARAELACSPEAVHPLEIGAKAPVFSLTSADGSVKNLAAIFSAKPTVLIFYRGGWCPYCNRHLAMLAELELPLRTLGFQIVAVSPDPVEKLVETHGRQHLRYQLLSDKDMLATPAYGLAYCISAENGKGFLENGIQLPPVPGSTNFWLPVPAAFIIDRGGVVRFVFSNADPEIRVSEAALLAAAKSVR